MGKRETGFEPATSTWACSGAESGSRTRTSLRTSVFETGLGVLNSDPALFWPKRSGLKTSARSVSALFRTLRRFFFRCV